MAGTRSSKRLASKATDAKAVAAAKPAADTPKATPKKRGAASTDDANPTPNKRASKRTPAKSAASKRAAAMPIPNKRTTKAAAAKPTPKKRVAASAVTSPTPSKRKRAATSTTKQAQNVEEEQTPSQSETQSNNLPEVPENTTATRFTSTDDLWALQETVDCVRGGCVLCAYKLLVAAPLYSRQNDTVPLDPKCAVNCRPEDCLRLHAARRDAKRRKREAHRNATMGGSQLQITTMPPLDSSPHRRGLYSPDQKTLIVGDGNFSFSLSLARARSPLQNKQLVCTSYQNAAQLAKAHPDSKQNIATLLELGCTVLHNVDATKLGDTLSSVTSDVELSSFDVIVFNFPCVPFAGVGQDGQSSEISENQALVQRFLLSAGADKINKKSVLATCHGQVHVAHKTKPPFGWWNVQALAGGSALEHAGEVVFDRVCYPEYVCRKAEDSKSFPVYDATTHVFGFQNKATDALPHIEAASAKAKLEGGEHVHVDWTTLPTHTTTSGAKLVKLSVDVLWAVVGVLQFAPNAMQVRGGGGRAGSGRGGGGASGVQGANKSASAKGRGKSDRKKKKK